jgi:hypothetical protein
VNALFRNPLGARLLVALGAIPVYRRTDDPDRKGRNVRMFAAGDEVFDGGRLVAIYSRRRPPPRRNADSAWSR